MWTVSFSFCWPNKIKVLCEQFFFFFFLSLLTFSWTQSPAYSMCQVKSFWAILKMKFVLKYDSKWQKSENYNKKIFTNNSVINTEVEDEEWKPTTPTFLTETSHWLKLTKIVLKYDSKSQKKVLKIEKSKKYPQIILS